MSDTPSTRTDFYSVQPYLIVNNAAEAMEFYKAALGATEHMRLPANDGRIAHAEIQFGNSIIMMADENPEVDAYSPAHYGGSSVSFMCSVEDCDAAYRKALDAGAKSEREPADQFYGHRVAGVLDPYGYRWYLSAYIKEVSVDEMKTHMASA